MSLGTLTGTCHGASWDRPVGQHFPGAGPQAKRPATEHTDGFTTNLAHGRLSGSSNAERRNGGGGIRVGPAGQELPFSLGPAGFGKQREVEKLISQTAKGTKAQSAGQAGEEGGLGGGREPPRAPEHSTQATLSQLLPQGRSDSGRHGGWVESPAEPTWQTGGSGRPKATR